MSTTPVSSHDDTRHFCCTYCQRTFRRLEHLQRHTRRHTNEKPFACSCGALFSRRDLLRRHERIVCHPDSNDAPGHILDDDEQSMQSHNKSSSAAPYNRGILDTQTPHGRDFIAYATPYSSGSLTSTHPDQPFRTVSNAFDNHSISPVSDQVLQQAGHERGTSEFAQSENNRYEPCVHECPTVFPSPQLSLATQIVPYCASPKVTPSDRFRLLVSLERVNNIFPHPNLPSVNAMTRYMAGYFTGFYPRFPFTHIQTLKLESCSPDLCLAMMAVGAMDRFEFTSAMELFYISKALLFDAQRNRAQSENVTSLSSDDSNIPGQLIDEVRCLFCLAQFASWQSHPGIRNEACILQSLLGHSLRSSSLRETAQITRALDWEEWSQRESERRTKLFAFCFLGIQSIAYDVPPSIWCEEIDLKLPCTCPEWTAPDATTWGLLRATVPKEQGRFNETLTKLLSPTYQADHSIAAPTPVGNYVLMHGLLHKILWTRKSISGILSSTSSKDFQSTLEAALQNWTRSWQQTPESNLEPLDPNGPLPFTSSALLSLAYVRNCSEVFQTRKILTWDPIEIARGLQGSLLATRERSSLIAAYHATNLLNTLIRLGVQYFKNNQAVLWSIEATLCGLDCSVFLEKWLRRVQETKHDLPLTDSETRLVHWIQDVVHEGLSSANDWSFTQAVRPAISPDQIITVWSHIMQGNSPFPFIKMIGEVLIEYKRLSVRGE